jgi:thiol:disulfide interchange protein
MKRYFWAVLAGFMVAASARAESVNWQADFDKAVASAKKDGKLVVVDLYTDWCGWCKKLDRDVYSDPKVIQKLAKDFVAVKINPEKTARARQLAQQFGTRGYPHIVFVNGDGKKIDELGGYVPAVKFLEKLDKVTKPEAK